MDKEIVTTLKKYGCAYMESDNKEMIEEIVTFSKEQGKAINYDQLHTEVFKLANKLAINDYGDEAVKMHEICNRM
jgi:hypothetical protein